MNKQASAKDYYDINAGGRVQPRERDLLKPQPGDDIYRKAFQRSLLLRSQKRSQRREESRSKNRLLTQQRIQNYSDEPAVGVNNAQVTFVGLEHHTELMEKLEIKTNEEEKTQVNV